MAALSPGFLVAVIGVVAAATFATRILPFLLFRDGLAESRTLRYLGHYLPMMIMIILVVYAFKDVRLTAAARSSKELIGGATTAILQVFVRNVLLSIIVGTLAYAVANRML